MKLSYLVLIPAFLCLLVPGVPARAGSLDNAVIALHAKPAAEIPISLCPADGEPSYDPNYDNLPCTDYTVTAPLNQGTHVYVVVGQVGEAGFNGVSFGVLYSAGGGPGNGIDEDLCTWTDCSSLSFPEFGWPKPDTGNICTWTECETQHIGGSGVHAVVGVFYVFAYSEDVLELTPNYSTEPPYRVGLAACSEEYLGLDFAQSEGRLGRIHFGGDGSLGYTPCGVVSMEPTTWGRIKSAYE